MRPTVGYSLEKSGSTVHQGKIVHTEMNSVQAEIDKLERKKDMHDISSLRMSRHPCPNRS